MCLHARVLRVVGAGFFVPSQRGARGRNRFETRPGLYLHLAPHELPPEQLVPKQNVPRKLGVRVFCPIRRRPRPQRVQLL